MSRPERPGPVPPVWRLLGRPLRLVLFAATLTFVSLWPQSEGARADGLADEADLHFQLGADCYRKADFSCALEHFLLSNRLVPNRNVVYNIARTYARLQRFADAYRYYVDALEGETDSRTVADINAALEQIAPNVGVLRVVTTPPGATIYIDRRDLGSRGRAPRPLALTPGRYKVIVDKQGHSPAESEPIEVRVGEQVEVKLDLEPIVGTVHVDVVGAPGASVHVGDEKAPPSCQAPCDLSLAPGTQLLYFSRPGFQALPRQVLVQARQTVRTVAKLEPLGGSLLVEADEQGAVVEIDGRPAGFTPAVIQNVPVGTRKVRVTMRGYKPVERTVEVGAKKQVELLGLRLVPLRQVAAVSRYVQDIDDAPSSLTVIDGQELQAFGYPTLAEAMRGVRGVSISNDYSYSSAGIRGLGEPNDYGNRLLVLSDGLAMNDNILNSSYIGTDGRVDLGDVERIEIVRGPGSLLYGTGAVSGVVNLVSRPRTQRTHAFGSIGTWGNSVARGRAGMNVGFAEDAGAWASIASSYSDGVDVPITLITPINGQQVQTARGAEAHRALTTAGHAYWGPVEAQWQYHKRSQYVPVGALATRFDDLRTTYTDERATGELRFDPKIGEYVELFTRAHVNHYAFHGFYVSVDPDPDLVENYYGTWLGAEARILIKPLDELRITVGGEAQFHPVADMYGEELGPGGGVIPDGSYLDEQNGYSFGAAYALLDTNPVDWFRLNAGARVDIYSTFGPIVVPRGALIFHPVQGGVLKLMSGRAFRAPSVYEQYYNDGGYSQVKAEDPDRDLTLEPESIFSNEIEYTQRFEQDWAVIGAAHLSWVENIINTIEDTPGSDVIRYANSDADVLVVGGDFEVRREWRQGWMLAAFYGYQRPQYLSPDDSALADNPRLVNAPEHLAGLKGVVPIVRDIASVAARASLEAPRRLDLQTDDLSRWAIVTDLAVSGGAPAYGVRYVVGVYNLFDWRYEVPVADTFASRTVPQRGRTFLAELSIAYP